MGNFIKLNKLRPILAALTILITLCNQAAAESDLFPASISPPSPIDFSPNPSHIYYCSPSGSNSSGDGSFDNPWVDMIGASSHVGPGDIIYLRGGTYPAYPYVNFSRSQNIISVSGTSNQPIVITNYPGEIAKWNSADTIWSLTLDGDFQKLIGTKVGSQYGIQITGGISVRANDIQVSGVEFIGGTNNGGDLNPAMLSVPLNEGCDNLIISHCFFHDSKHQSSASRMACIRFFRNTNSIIEYNVFLNNWELKDCACVYYKDNTRNSTVRYNKFINSEKGVQYFTQDFVGGGHNGLSVYNNLFYNVRYSLLYRNEYGPNIKVYNNTSLAIPGNGSFFYYLNANPVSAGNDHGDYWNNVIQGTAFVRGWHSNSSNASNMPDSFDYNLWFSSADRNTPWGDLGYHQHAVTAASSSEISFNAENYTAVASDNYSGRGKGRDGDDIGGFSFSTRTPDVPEGFSIDN